MAVSVIMPRQGQSVESCVLTEWNKKVGDEVKTGDVLFTYETDKSAFEEEAKLDGTLLAVFFNVDDDVPCLTNVAVIGTPGEDFSQFSPNGSGQAATASPDAPATAPEAAADAAIIPAIAPVAIRDGANAPISPRARVTAQELHVDPAFAEPTGPNGRIIERDVVALAKNGTMATAAAISDMIARHKEFSGTGVGGRVTTSDLEASPAVCDGSSAKAAAPVASIAPAAPDALYTEQKLSNIRKVIAKSMQQSLASMAQLTHNSSFDATKIQQLRATLKKAQEKFALPNITLNDMVLFAASRILMKYPALNANLVGENLRSFAHVHLGVAVDTPRGLLVPTLFNADTKSLKEISIEAKALAKAAQEGNINPDLLTGGTFTISNLGSLGIESFTPIINPPQTGILGVDCIVERVRSLSGSITTYPAMGLSLTYDHRAIDGAPASRFLQELCVALENIDILLVG